MQANEGACRQMKHFGQIFSQIGDPVVGEFDYKPVKRQTGLNPSRLTTSGRCVQNGAFNVSWRQSFHAEFWREWWLVWMPFRAD